MVNAAGILPPAGTPKSIVRHDGSIAGIAGAGLQPPAGAYDKIDSRPPYLSNDTYVEKQWSLDRVHIPATWAIAPHNEVVVAILDTGIDTKHEDLAGIILGSINLTTSATAEDVFGHGTHVAGIITARTNNSVGIAGITRNIKLLNVKIAGDNGDCSSLDVANGIIWAADRAPAHCRFAEYNQTSGRCRGICERKAADRQLPGCPMPSGLRPIERR